MSGRVRVATVADAGALAALYAPYVEATSISFEEAAPTAAEFAERIGSTLAVYPFLVFEDAGGLRGYAYAAQHRTRAAYRWSVDVSAYVAEGHHGRGIGRALYAELLALLERQGFHAAFAGIALPNDKSVGLHEAMGFRPVGVYKEVGFKQGAWRDVGWWGRPLRGGGPPDEPVPFPRLRP